MSTTNRSMGQAVRSVLDEAQQPIWRVAVACELSPAQLRDRISGRVPFRLLELLRLADVLGRERLEFVRFVVEFDVEIEMFRYEATRTDT